MVRFMWSWAVSMRLPGTVIMNALRPNGSKDVALQKMLMPKRLCRINI